MNNLCKEIQQHSDHNNPKDLFKTIKVLTKKFKARTWTVKDKQKNNNRTGRNNKNVERILPGIILTRECHNCQAPICFFLKYVVEHKNLRDTYFFTRAQIYV